MFTEEVRKGVFVQNECDEEREEDDAVCHEGEDVGLIVDIWTQPRLRESEGSCAEDSELEAGGLIPEEQKDAREHHTPESIHTFEVPALRTKWAEEE